MPVVAFWNALGRRIAQYLGSRAHVNVTIIIKDGAVQQVRFDESVLPKDLLGH